MKTLLTHITIVVLLLVIPMNGMAADVEEDTDSLSCKGQYYFKAAQLAVPGTLLLAGVMLGINRPNSVIKGVDSWFGSGITHADDYLRFAPSAAYLGLMTVPGEKGQNRIIDRVLLTATAHALSLGSAYALKKAVRASRPDNSDNHGFPSGHVALAFTGAELLRLEYGNTYGMAGYAVACAVAVMRLSNHRHYLNDVLFGAGLGILGARAAYLLLPFEQRLSGLSAGGQRKITAVVTPGYDITAKGLTMNFSARF